ncbi:hypothetical protein M885DRAFT_573689 [Pelagophyceae sp. CCMP2097]|nr:hypothetical protein M885DRAFT_573689 [Pelagophyceae sp. CCMP2097]
MFSASLALSLAAASAGRLGSRRAQDSAWGSAWGDGVGPVSGPVDDQDGNCCFFSFEASKDDWCSACVTPSVPSSWCSQSAGQCFDDCGANVGSAVWCAGGAVQDTPPGFEPSDCCLFSQDGLTCDVFADLSNFCATDATSCATCSGGDAFWIANANVAGGGTTVPGECCLYDDGEKCAVYEVAGEWCAASAEQCTTCSGGLAYWVGDGAPGGDGDDAPDGPAETGAPATVWAPTSTFWAPTVWAGKPTAAPAVSGVPTVTGAPGVSAAPTITFAPSPLESLAPSDTQTPQPTTAVCPGNRPRPRRP